MTAQRAAPAVRWSRWLAEPGFPTRVYGYGSTALPFFILQRTCRLVAEDPLSTPLAAKAPLRFMAPWLVRRPEQFGRSEAEAKLHLWKLDPDPE